MSNFVTLTFNTFQHGTPVALEIRALHDAGVRWFVAADLCRALDLHVRSSGQPNTAVALPHVDSHEKCMRRLEVMPGTLARTMLVTDAGFYKLIHRSPRRAAWNGPASRHSRRPHQAQPGRA